MSVEITIIIPVYNTATYLKNCINSIKQQIFSNYEVILIDDGSTDDSAKIIKELAQQDTRFKLLSQQNLGQGIARNQGLKIAQGNYITFIDSDDYVTTDYLSSLYHQIIQEKADICSCDYFIKHGKSEVRKGVKNLNLSSNREIVHAFLSEQIPTIFCAKLFKYSLFEGIEFPSGKFEDSPTFIHLIVRNQVNKLTHIDRALYYYVYRAESTTNTLDQQKIDDHFTALAYIRQLLKDYGKEQQYWLDYCAFYAIYTGTRAGSLVRQGDSVLLQNFLSRLNPNIINKTILCKLLISKKLDIGRTLLTTSLTLGRLGQKIFALLHQARQWLRRLKRAI